MKEMRITILCFVMSLLIVACDTHDVLDDLGATNGVPVANVYMEAMAPLVQVSADVTIEVQYWSLDNEFSYTGLWDFVAQTLVMEVSIDGEVFSQEFTSDFQDWEEYQVYPFDFSYWSPKSNAYVRDVSYVIDLAHDKVSKGSDDVTFNEFVGLEPEEKTFENAAYNYYTRLLSRAYLNDLMIDNGIMTQQEFDNLYQDNGSLTGDGEETIQSGLATIGLSTLVGVNYQADLSYDITLAFRVVNGSTSSNEFRRSFGIF